MKQVNETVTPRRRPVTILQYGEGNFLRAFVDWMVDIANEKGVTNDGIALVKPIAYGSLEALRAQDNVYTVLLRGQEGGEVVEDRRVVSSVQQAVDCYTEYEAYMALAELDTLRFVVSNTTEAGIALDEGDRLDLCPPRSYPGKLTKLLFARYGAFSGAADKGLILLPVELIEKNGDKLRDCVLRLAEIWELPADFRRWVEAHCLFCNTLVDRIVTGYPAGEAAALQEAWGYEDKLMVTGEPFALWVIEHPAVERVREALPLDAAGLPVVFTHNLRPYRERKVRILNGAHTGTVLGAYLAGLDTVGECMADPIVRPYLERLLKEIAPTVPLPADEVAAFAASVMERFGNPFIRHQLLAISLNSVSKWRARILPSLLDGLEQTGTLPPLLTFSFAALLAFYRSTERTDSGLTGHRESGTYTILDDAAALDFFAAHAGDRNGVYVEACAANAALWGSDLTQLPDFTATVSHRLFRITQIGIRAAMEEVTRS